MRPWFHQILRLALLLGAACPLEAQEPVIPITFKGIYEFGMLGLTFGRMGVEAEQSARHYTITSDIQLSGLAKLFMQHKSHTEVKASGADFKYINVEYETHYQTKKKKRHVKLVYKDGVLVDEVVEPLNPRRPKVPPELKNQAFDPLSFLLTMREKLASALAAREEKFSLNLFDGKTLMQMDLSIEKEPGTLNYKGHKVPVVAVSGRQKPIAGFTSEELKDFDDSGPALNMYFSKDERLIPLCIKSKAWLGTLTGTLVKECRAGESCLLKTP